MKITKKTLGLIILFLMITVQTFAQYKKKAPKEVAKMIWGHKDPALKVKFDAEKYKDKSGVILYQNYHFDYLKRNQTAYKESFFRRRIKLLDQAALKEYSDFEFDKKEKYSDYSYGYRTKKGVNYFNIRVIKPTGKIIKIDLKKQAVTEDDKKKIAIPNLEIGDIVDYYYYNYESIRVPYTYTFEPVMTSLKTEFPIIKEKLDLKLSKAFYLNFKNLNGAPDLKQVPSGNKRQKAYEITLENIEPRRAKRWIFPLMAYPSIKFQVYFSKNTASKKQIEGFLAKEKGTVKKNVTKEDILQAYKGDYFKPFSKLRNLGKKTIKNETSIKRKIEKFYDELRYYGAGQMLREIILKDVGESYYLGGPEYNISNPYKFHSILNDFLKKENVKHDIVLVNKRPLGGNKELLIKSNLKVLTRVFLPKGKVMYLASLFDDPLFALPDEINPLLESNSAYALKLDKRGKPVSVEEITVRSSKSKENLMHRTMTVNFDKDLKNIKIAQTTNLTGAQKWDMRDAIVSLYDFFDEVYAKHHKGESVYESFSGSKKKKRSIVNAIKSAIKQDKQDRAKRLKKGKEKFYKVKIKDYDFDVVKVGRDLNQRDFEYKENFTVKDGLTKKAGRNILFEAGKLIGKQINVDKKMMERSEDIYRAYPYLDKYVITIEVPAGFTVKGLNKFNKSIKNSVGRFESKAELKDGKIVLNVEEEYFKNFESNSHWKDMTDILKTAYQLSQEKLLFKK